MKRRHPSISGSGLLPALLLASQNALAAVPSGHAHTETGPFSAIAARSSAYVDSKPPLWGNLGTLSYAITTDKPQAQQYFDQGLRLAYAFNHLEAQRAFRAAQKLDPQCAMCYWGEALVLGPNINAPMDASAVVPAWTALNRAQALSRHSSVKEQALIEALTKRYAKNPRADRTVLDRAYASAMGELASRFPEDEQITVLFAESLMDLSPWNYWEDGGRRPRGRTAEIVKVLERVLAAHPDHPGAIHYYIHMVEASDRPERAEPYARRLPGLMPGAGHLVHMPFHIYFRLGRYLDALEANKAGVAADEAYIAQATSEGIYAQGYYPHNLHSLMASAQMAGDGQTALAAADKLVRVVSESSVRTVPWTEPIKAAAYFAHAQFNPPGTVLALSDPGTGMPYVQAMWHYARGVAFAAGKDDAALRREAEAIAQIGANTDFSRLEGAGIPVQETLRLTRHVLLGRGAQAKGDLKSARAEFEQAVAIQDRLPYTEPPHWYYPVRQSLGAVILLSGDLQGAEEAFKTTLDKTPNNGWALFGLTEVYQRRGDEGKAEATRKLLDQAWAGDRRSLDLMRL